MTIYDARLFWQLGIRGSRHDQTLVLDLMNTSLRHFLEGTVGSIRGLRLQGNTGTSTVALLGV